MIDISPYYQHTAQLQLNRRYAEGIADDIVSAKTYSGETPSVYIRLLHKKAYPGVFYYPQKIELREPNIVNVLDAIACHEGTEIANVDYDEVEKLSHSCIQAWCEKHHAKWEDVERICTLYLKPEKAGDGWADLLI